MEIKWVIYFDNSTCFYPEVGVLSLSIFKNIGMMVSK